LKAAVSATVTPNLAPPGGSGAALESLAGRSPGQLVPMLERRK
jgi:hypothetical protein